MKKLWKVQWLDRKKASMVGDAFITASNAEVAVRKAKKLRDWQGVEVGVEFMGWLE